MEFYFLKFFKPLESLAGRLLDGMIAALGDTDTGTPGKPLPATVPDELDSNQAWK